MERIAQAFRLGSSSKEEEQIEYARQNERIVTSIMGGSRVSSDKKDGNLFRKGKFYRRNFDDQCLTRHSPKQLLDMLRYNHPDMGQAIWNFQIMGNNSFTINVTKLDGSEHLSGQKVIEDFIRNLDYVMSQGYEKNRSIPKTVDTMIEHILVRGATSMEIVLDEELENVKYFAVVDPDSIEFIKEKGRLIPLQGMTKLDIPTFFHEGIDESDDDPYGTSPFLSAIKTLVFHMEVLQDLKMVVHNQGYGKYDIKIVEEVLLKRMPISIRNNEAKKQTWLNDRLSEIIDMYSKLDPDAAFVHFDSVEVDMVDGAKATIDPQKLMAVIDSQIQNALKQYSTFMGRRSTGQTEQYARMEARIFFKSVRRVQLIIENIMSRALTKVLHFNGMQGYVKFEFDGIDLRSEIEKVNFDQIAITNAATKRDQGWITQDEASVEVVGHKAVGEPDKEMLGVEKPQGNMDERQPSNRSSSDNTSTGDN